MAAMKLRLVLCFLLGLCSAATAERQYEVRLDAKSTYPHAGRVDVFVNGSWATICAPDWDISDGEVICRDLGLGFVNTITVSGGVNQASPSPSKCLRSVTCYGHEERLSDCIGHEFGIRSDGNDKGVVCYPPPSDAGVRLTLGPDQYSGFVQVKLASGSWDELWAYDSYCIGCTGYWYRHLPNICRQLGYGELNWWDVYEYGSATSMTYVHSCAYGVADHRSCTFQTGSEKFQPYVGCHKPGSIPCSAPYVPKHSTVQDLRLNYNFGDRVNVTCDVGDEIFALQCHNKGLWSGPVVSCPEPPAVTYRHRYCSAPALPQHSTIHNLRLTYKDGDPIDVTCDYGSEDHRTFNLSCVDGKWEGENVICPDPVLDCNPPIIPAVSSVEGGLESRYKIGDDVNITCNDASDYVVWYCQNDGLWRGDPVNCAVSQSLTAGTPAGRSGNVNSTDSQDGRNILITGLLVAAVIMFVLVLMSMVAFSISFKSSRITGSSKDGLHDGKAGRGPLPDVPEGYEEYLVGDKSLYTEPYLKPNELPYESYGSYEKPA